MSVTVCLLRTMLSDLVLMSAMILRTVSTLVSPSSTVPEATSRTSGQPRLLGCCGQCPGPESATTTSPGPGTPSSRLAVSRLPASTSTLSRGSSLQRATAACCRARLSHGRTQQYLPHNNLLELVSQKQNVQTNIRPPSSGLYVSNVSKLT